MKPGWILSKINGRDIEDSEFESVFNLLEEGADSLPRGIRREPVAEDSVIHAVDAKGQPLVDVEEIVEEPKMLSDDIGAVAMHEAAEASAAVAECIAVGPDAGPQMESAPVAPNDVVGQLDAGKTSMAHQQIEPDKESMSATTIDAIVAAEAAVKDSIVHAAEANEQTVAGIEARRSNDQIFEEPKVLAGVVPAVMGPKEMSVGCVKCHGSGTRGLLGQRGWGLVSRQCTHCLALRASAGC